MEPIILAIDPGTTQSAYVLWDGVKVLECEILDNYVMREYVLNYGPDGMQTYLAIEGIASYGMSVGAEVFQTCYWVGRFMECGNSIFYDTKICLRRDIKLHLCGTARAKDGNIRQALIDRLGVVGTKKNKGPLYGIKSHLWAALAIAVYARDIFDPSTILTEQIKT